MVFILYVAIDYANNTNTDIPQLVTATSLSAEPIILGIPPTIPFPSETAHFGSPKPSLLTTTPIPHVATLPALALPSPALALTIIPPPMTRAEGAANGQTYTVQPGDNLFRIALRFGVSAEALAQANALSDPSLIVAGQVLRIPSTLVPSATPMSAYLLFVV
ncbi:MAG: LysM peptidoglycan-binding domain-containing protein [Anaerolineae bacterium]|nr:LysM peptidoglycan-binding domain-containing protein [Anaerolineae bacterium]MDW8171141.1 LysM peptidoglycan-binding domain-containing protein [Anaerolineae bacterium]